jgi:hypothetical protein
LYTTDGTDPRAVGGANSGSAINGGNAKSITVKPGTHLKTRIKYASTWSALHDIIFEDSGLFSNLKVTELHYHPKNQGLVDDKELEFIELKNIGTTTLDLSGMAFTDGIQFTFPAGSKIVAGAFFVLASNKTEFFNFYKTQPNFEYTGSLSNGGEPVTMQSASKQNVISFTYSDSIPWPVEADGDGYSLVATEVNPTGDPDSHTYWTISKYENGSPLADDLGSVTATTDLHLSDINFSIYPNPATSGINIDFSLHNAEKTEISLFDLNGRLLQILVNEQLPAGDHSKYITPGNLNSGLYLITLKTEKKYFTKKLIYNK